jgi:hypothetical protein
MAGTTERAGLWERVRYRGPSVDVLYDDYARRHRIDEAAPIVARRELVIAAPVGDVWRILSSPETWPRVDPAIRDVRVHGEVAAGTRFTWRNGRARLSSRFAVVEAEQEISWVGSGSGARAVHRHWMVPTADGGTCLATEESMAGWPVVLVLGDVKLQRMLDRWLRAIATAAE